MPSLSPLSYLILALIACAGVVEVWSADPESTRNVSWWRLMLAGYLLALVYERLRSDAGALAVAVPEAPPLRLGRRSVVAASIVNNGAQALEIRYALDLPEALDVSKETQALRLEAARATDASFALLPLSLGDQPWSRLPLRILGPLRLAWWPASLPVGATLRVLPDALSSHDRTSGLVGRGSTAERRQGSGQELHHLRDYRPGDPRHAIDWKATARSGALATSLINSGMSSMRWRREGMTIGKTFSR